MSRRKDQFIAQLYAQQSTRLVQYLTSRFQNRAEAEEVAQEAWLRIFRLDSPQQLDNARAFLFQTASNLSIDRLRRHALERKHAEVIDEVSPTIEDELVDHEALKIIEGALAELPLKCRQAFVLHRHSGLSYEQISQQLDVSVSMVEKYIIQALKHFRNKLAQKGGEE